jgi:heme A synthase
MAADCKSAAPWSYGGSNPPLSTSFEARSKWAVVMNRLLAALAVLLVLAVVAARTLTDERIRLATFVILGFFAVRIVIAHRFKGRDEKL